MNEPTARQKRVLRFIADFLAQHGYPPTHAEIARGLGFRSQNAASEHVRLLVKKGRIAVTPGVARGLRLVGGVEGELPLIGEVSAGQPILAEAHVERRVAFDAALFRPRPDYLLRVRGDSMIEAGIRPRDLVAVKSTREVASGRIAVVRLEDEVTVKRLVKKGHKVVLEPANRRLSPIVVDLRHTAVTLEGLVVGLLRLDLKEDAS